MTTANEARQMSDAELAAMMRYATTADQTSSWANLMRESANRLEARALQSAPLPLQAPSPARAERIGQFIHDDLSSHLVCDPAWLLERCMTMAEHIAAMWDAAPEAPLPGQSDALKDALAKIESIEWWEGIYDGKPLTKEQIVNELHDFRFMMGEVPKVYMEVTGGLLSKTNYHASAVIGVYNEHVEKLIAEAIKEELEERDATPSPAGQQGEAMTGHEIPRQLALKYAGGTDVIMYDEVQVIARAYLSALRASAQPTPPEVIKTGPRTTRLRWPVSKRHSKGARDHDE